MKALRKANLEALVNPSAYFQKLIDNLRYSKVKSRSTSLTTNSFTRPEAQSSLTQLSGRDTIACSHAAILQRHPVSIGHGGADC